MDGSFNELRQMAHVSAQISHDHMATAFHFLISNRGITESPFVFVPPPAAAGAEVVVLSKIEDASV
jgi:hypothetical protein